MYFFRLFGTRQLSGFVRGLSSEAQPGIQIPEVSRIQNAIDDIDNALTYFNDVLMKSDE